MTSDAKVGLLLGLVFIFIIAFIINGFPNLHNDADNNELTSRMVDSQNGAAGLAGRGRKVSREVISRMIKPVGEEDFQPEALFAEDRTVRFETELPVNSSPAPRTVAIEPAAPAQLLTEVKEKEDCKTKPADADLPKIYIVNEGDNLAIIAKKFYGTENGNKKRNVARIFEANRKFLKSSDEIYVGQKLVIPPLSVSRGRGGGIDSILASSIQEKAESVVDDKSFPGAGRQNKRHIVREGDSLWQIAAEQLGNGSRYREIVKLNIGVIKDEDNLCVGMSLKLPAR